MDAQIDAIGRPETWGELFDPRSRAALRLADAVSADSHAIEPDLVEQLRSEFTETELAELILVAGQANLNNRAGNAAKQLLGP
jgi:alkylhydroperoxidase family enzyme